MDQFGGHRPPGRSRGRINTRAKPQLPRLAEMVEYRTRLAGSKNIGVRIPGKAPLARVGAEVVDAAAEGPRIQPLEAGCPPADGIRRVASPRPAHMLLASQVFLRAPFRAACRV